MVLIDLRIPLVGFPPVQGLKSGGNIVASTVKLLKGGEMLGF